LARTRLTEQEALAIALAALHPGVRAPAAVSREGNVTSFLRGEIFHAEPTVERVAIATSAGQLQTGFLVETWTTRGNQLHLTLVSGDGRVLDVENRTNSDSYNVFPNSPTAGAQTVLAGPGAGNAQSPAGWLSGAQKTTNIVGNNVNTYLDTDANNAADPGGASVTTGDFLTTASLTTQPSTSSNREVAIANLFYLNNVAHDALYAAGFNEASGNFQTNNFGKGGRGADAVKAEAQDGSGTDNANFATPRDGQAGRMQMYLWNGVGTHQLATPGGDYLAAGAEFGPAFTATGVSGNIVLATDATGAANDGCEALTNAAQVAGNIALADRGVCSFTVKVKNAQLAGATAVIVANNAGDSLMSMGGTDTTITVSSLFIGQSDAAALRAALPTTGTARLSPTAPLMRDGDVDADIVFHEYAHGLTWRMIGRMSGAVPGAIGEGMSDVFAILMNEDDRVGEYSFSNSIGIRAAPYTNFPRTFSSVTGTEVHYDGEVYGAIGWQLYLNYTAAGISKQTLLADLVDGMHYTPAGPYFETMRDGILQSIAARGVGRQCLVWSAFAKYGVGVGAKTRLQGSKVVPTESFARPATCP
ncbi:MAG: protease-associated domain protein, partial [Myxococcaceae bacterium]|nr:protease-associated domain protein [Myxococcaceae bacterium]